MSAPVTARPAPAPLSARVLGIALGYGALAGAVAGFAFGLMEIAQHAIWSLPVADAPWYVAVAILVGGVGVGLLNRHGNPGDLDALLATASDPRSVRRKAVGVTALSAIVAVGFGGAVGPEAGLVALVAELSAIVATRIARSHAEEELVGQAGSAAVLAGLYGSPPGASAYDDDSLAPPKLGVFLAATSGFVAFFSVLKLFRGGGMAVELPPLAAGPGDLVLSVVPGVLGAGVALGFVALWALLQRQLGRLGRPFVATLVGTSAFALLAVAWPLARFSGHEDFPALLSFAGAGNWAMVAGLALLTPVATALCLASGWKGGAFFPVALTGAASGALALAVVPGLPLTAAVVAGLGAAATVGLRKPLAALLVSAFVVGGVGLGPLLVGTAVGALAVRLVKVPTPDHAH